MKHDNCNCHTPSCTFTRTAPVFCLLSYILPISFPFSLTFYLSSSAVLSFSFIYSVTFYLSFRHSHDLTLSLPCPLTFSFFSLISHILSLSFPFSLTPCLIFPHWVTFLLSFPHALTFASLFLTTSHCFLALQHSPFSFPYSLSYPPLCSLLSHIITLSIRLLTISNMLDAEGWPGALPRATVCRALLCASKITCRSVQLSPPLPAHRIFSYSN